MTNQNTNPTAAAEYYITPEIIGQNATIDDARAVAEYLTKFGYQSSAHDTCGVTPRGYGDINDIPLDVWMDAILSAFPMRRTRERYTLTAKGCHARTPAGLEVIVPDEVAEDQQQFDGRVFPVLGLDGKRRQAQLRGDLYGLHTPGTGDMVVSII